MHMADALISPAVGGALLAVTAGVAAYSVKKIQNQNDLDDKKIPLMGVMGAFIFAMQMINFTIPGTGSSGHIGGGILLAVLLGPYAGFLTMAAVLLIQALFFGDGGLLAYGCNVFNLGFYTCFIGYPIYKWFTSKNINPRTIFWASLISVVIALQLGAFSVVMETLWSNKTELPFATFVALMQPIHLAIGIIEGLITSAVVVFVWKARPELLARTASGKAIGDIPLKRILTGLAAAVIIIGGTLSWFASTNPDGLEWAMIGTAGSAELEVPDGIHQTLSALQDRIAILPDYGFEESVETTNANESVREETWPAVDAGTSVSGILGGGMTLALAGFMGFIITRFKKGHKSETA